MGPRPMIHTLQRIRRPFPIARSEAKPASSPPERPPVFPQGMLEEFEGRPLGGGEMLPAPPPAPTPAPQPAGLQIEEPPWKGQPPHPGLPETPSDPASLGAQALAELKAQDDPYDPPPPPISEGPMQPLLPVKIPPPNWRAEELDRIRRERLEAGLDEEHPGRRPPPRREPA